jgi:hypothetical protein
MIPLGLKRLTGILGTALLLAVAGCGKHGSHAAISGAVQLDGKPLEKGSILFMPMKGTEGVVTGGEIVDGHYELKGDHGPAIGWNRVEVQAVKRSGKMVQDPMGPKGQQVEMLLGAVAPRFNGSSTLKFEVKPGDNTADFQVESK